VRTRTLALVLTLTLTFVLIPTLALILTLALAGGGGDSPRGGGNDSARNPADELLGKWQLVETEAGGKKADRRPTPDIPIGRYLTFTRRHQFDSVRYVRQTMFLNYETEERKGTYRVIPGNGRAGPPVLEITWAPRTEYQLPEAGPPGVGKPPKVKRKRLPGWTARMIYEVRGDSLRTCQGADLPAQFSGAAGSGCCLKTYRRVAQ
jgi:hypothetical protein